jgi:hypothetical protein|tara:strand:- start:382 stop:612 length:231 start_codon:yes stop_codon:yes gene_type:complete
MAEEEKSIEVTFKFLLPEHETELRDFKNGERYAGALYDIDNTCRTVMKYEDAPTDDRVQLAEAIRDLIHESGVLEE